MEHLRAKGDSELEPGELAACWNQLPPERLSTEAASSLICRGFFSLVHQVNLGLC